MRHDDTIMTAVALAKKDSPDASAAAFRQLVDLSLQGRIPADRRVAWQALRTMTKLARRVPPGLRDTVIDKLAKGSATALHLRLFRHEISHHYDRLLQTAKLDEPEWWRFARRAPPHLRPALLSRRDLPAPVREMLSSTVTAVDRLFVKPDGAVDNAAEAPSIGRRPGPDMSQPAITPALDTGRSQVRELIDRIAAFRGKAPKVPTGLTPIGAEPSSFADRWTWQCDETGVFIGSPDMPEDLVGHWLTEIESPEAPLKIAQSFERRASFRDCTAILPVAGAAHHWRMSGLPQFDRKSGRFTGYWGSAIALDKPVAAPARQEPGLYGTGASGEAFATMAHEVRTPLNAIIGFAQLIENEILGEAGESYKESAGTILKHAEKLLSAFDDLSDAARIEQGRFRTAHEPFNAEAHAMEILARYASLASERGVKLVPYIASNIPLIDADSSVFDRMLSRLMTSAIGSAENGEALFVIVQPASDTSLRVAVSRPRATIGMSQDSLFTPVPKPEEDDGLSLLGVGFGLKLVASLAGTVGGRFTVTDHAFELTLPSAAGTRESAVS